MRTRLPRRCRSPAVARARRGARTPALQPAGRAGDGGELAPHDGRRRLRATLVADDALLVEALDDVDVRDEAVDRPAGERRRDREVAEVPDKHPAEPRDKAVLTDVQVQQPRLE